MCPHLERSPQPLGARDDTQRTEPPGLGWSLFLKKFKIKLKNKDKVNSSPGQVAQLVRASSQYAKVAGSMDGQDT